MIRRAAVGLAAALTVTPAFATTQGTYDFAYTDPGQISLVGRLTGEAIDSNTVKVLSLVSLSFDGATVDVSTLAITGSVSSPVFSRPGVDPKVTFSGSAMDWGQVNAARNNYFGFVAGVSGAPAIVDLVIGGTSRTRPFNAQNWSL